MENKKPQQPPQNINLIAATKSSIDEMVKLAGSYAPKGTTNRKAYISLIVEKNLTYKDKQGKTQSGSMTDLVTFMHLANHTGLDPLTNQIHTQWRWDSKLGRYRMIVITGIDGFRLSAQRSKLYGGQDDIEYKVEETFDPIDSEMKKQLVATATVYRVNPKNNERMPIRASARWNEYVVRDSSGNITSFWKNSPYNQLGKCAEALAFRKGFPQELSGLYASEEIGIDGNIDATKEALSSLPKPEKVLEKEAAKQIPTPEVEKEVQKPIEVSEEKSSAKMQEILAKKKNLVENKEQK